MNQIIFWKEVDILTHIRSTLSHLYTFNLSTISKE